MKPISPRPITKPIASTKSKTFRQRMFWPDAIPVKATVKVEHAIPVAKSIDFIANLIVPCGKSALRSLL